MRRSLIRARRKNDQPLGRPETALRNRDTQSTVKPDFEALLATGHGEPDLGQELCIEFRPVMDPMLVGDFIALAKRIKRIAFSRM